MKGIILCYTVVGIVILIKSQFSYVSSRAMRNGGEGAVALGVEI